MSDQRSGTAQPLSLGGSESSELQAPTPGGAKRRSPNESALKIRCECGRIHHSGWAAEFCRLESWFNRLPKKRSIR